MDKTQGARANMFIFVTCQTLSPHMTRLQCTRYILSSSWKMHANFKADTKLSYLVPAIGNAHNKNLIPEIYYFVLSDVTQMWGKK